MLPVGRMQSRCFRPLFSGCPGGSPRQVAETFTLGIEDGSAAELKDVARLDTCVTVVDAANLMANFASLQSLRQVCSCNHVGCHGPQPSRPYGACTAEAPASAQDFRVSHTGGGSASSPPVPTS